MASLRRARTALASLILSAAALSPLAVAADQVLTVGCVCLGEDFSTAQEAVNAASEGAVIVVKSGSQGGLIIDGKSVTVVIYKVSTDPKFFKVTVKNLAAHQSVTLRGLSLGTSIFDLNQCEIRDCAGSVFLEGCEAYVAVHNSPRVVLSRCTLQGADGGPFPTTTPEPTQPALTVQNSFVTVYESSLAGGGGVSAGIAPFTSTVSISQAGAPAIDLASGTCVLAKCTVRGGSGGGGFANLAVCLPGSHGGTGAEVDGTLVAISSTIQAGFEGFSPQDCQLIGSGPPALIVGPAGSVSTGAEPVRSLSVFHGGPSNGVAPMGSDVWTRFDGLPGENALLLVSFQPSGAYVLALHGPLAGAAPFVPLPLGVVPASGRIEFSAPLPPTLPAGVEGIVLYEQALVAGSAGTGLVSSPSVFTAFQP